MMTESLPATGPRPAARAGHYGARRPRTPLRASAVCYVTSPHAWTRAAVPRTRATCHFRGTRPGLQERRLDSPAASEKPPSRGGYELQREASRAQRGFERNFVRFPVLLNCSRDVTFGGDSSYHRWSRPSQMALPAGTLWLPASRDAFSTASDQDGRRPRPDISPSRKARPSGFRTPAILDHQRRPTQPAA